MAIKETLLPEFDQEMATTRQLLERTPEAQAASKPHPKSWNLGQLAVHIANLPTWTGITLRQTEFDLDPPGGSSFTPPSFESTSGLVKIFDENVKNARATIVAASDQDFMVGWTLKKAGASIFTLPRVAVVRSFVMNHLIHHRGQFSVYLRMQNVPLPSIYGPTADTPV